MKKLFLTFAAVLMFTAMNAQTGLGINGGLFMAMGKAELGGYSEDDSQTGFYVGIYKEFPLGQGFQLQPAVNAVVVDEEFMLQVPVIFKYYVASGFNLQAGPQFLFNFEDQPNNFTGFNFGLGLGAGYDFTDRLMGEVRYGLQLNDHYTGDGDLSLKLNTLNIGIGYQF